MESCDSVYPRQDVDHRELGITIRQHFAAMAMQAYISNSNVTDDFVIETNLLGIAQKCVMLADALITELNKTTK